MANDSAVKTSSSYRQIMKGTSIFGGVQVFNIIITIIRSKVIAVLLGPAGMGISGLLTSTTTFIGSLTNFGLRVSSVKDIAAAHNSNDELKVTKTVMVVRRLVWLTGILGTLVTIIFAGWLSELSFGNREYTYSFIWLSITLLFNQLTSGQSVLLQGMRKLKYLATANVIGAASALLVSIPLYYYFRVNGIVPALIITALFTLLANIYFARKVKISKIDISWNETKVRGRGMMVMGFVLSLSGIMTMGAAYIVRIFISNKGGLDDVGLFNAGFAIINTYVGLIFTAMSTDYYPRLSGIAEDNQKTTLLVNQQAEVAILILAPILTIFLIFIDIAVVLLYSKQFIATTEMIYWAALGIFFKSVSWAISYVFLAKSASKVFFWNELISIVCMTSLNLLGYYYWALAGLGFSFMLSYLIYLIQVYLVARKKYSFTLNKGFLKIFAFQLFVAICCFIISKSVIKPWSYMLGVLCIIISVWFSFKELDKRLRLRQLLNSYKNKLWK
ncbi:MAG: O-antigen translocase [Bacteroidota bacterium]